MKRNFIHMKIGTSIYVLNVFVMGIATLSAQNQKIFEDRYGKQGIITHSGEWNDTILPKTGNYSFKWRNISQDTVFTYAASGFLRNHLPHGSWKWEEAVWEFFIEPGAGIEPEFRTDAHYQLWNGNFNNGVANGQWSYAFGPPSLNPRSSTTPVVVTAELKDNKFIRQFKIIDNLNRFELTGFCNNNGIPEKTWTFTYFEEEKKVKEKRTYNQGVLVQFEVEKEGEKPTKHVFQDRVDFISAKKDTLDNITIGNHDFLVDDYGNTAMDFYQENVFNHFLAGWKHEQFNFQLKLTPPRFKQLNYLISEEEKKTINQLKAINSQLKADIQARYDYGNLKLKRSRSKELDLSIAFVEIIEERAKIIDSLLAFSLQPEFTYLNRNNGALEAWVDSLNSLTNVEAKVYPEHVVTLKSILSYAQDSTYFFKKILGNQLELMTKFDAHLNQIDTSFAKIEKEGQLKSLENDLELGLSRLDSIYSTQEGLGAFIAEHWVKRHLNSELIQYAKINDFNLAKLFAEQLNSKIDSLEHWVSSWGALDTISTTLKNSYKYMVVNPYSGERDMEIKVKRRFLKTVEEVLIPWMFEQIKTAETWDEFSVSYRNLYLTKTYLVKFAHLNEKSDSRIERRIRNEKNPEKMLTAFMNYMKDR
jgi:hypothetical protein